VFLLDSDCLTIVQRHVEPEWRTLRQRMAEFSDSDFCTPIVSFHEQVSGWFTYLNRAKKSEGVVRAYSKFQELLTGFAAMTVVPFNDVAARQFDALQKQRIRVGTLDLRIAAIALTRDLTLISRNLVDFERVPGLRVEDWTKAA
jgi:tRNA(fMet)-specific endonuclease VapC